MAVDASQGTVAPPILIAGATASGKSNLALALAQRLHGVIVNADSMQVYAELPILTAQPSTAELHSIPHRLYGHVKARDAYSTGRYLADVRCALAEARAARLRPIIVGGTGLYFTALLQGLSPVPPIPAEVRARWRNLSTYEPASTLWYMLKERDPVMAARLERADLQRVVRALEVYEATGRSLASWWQEKGTPLIDDRGSVKLVVDRSRRDLHARCDARLDRMMAAGALDEVAALAAQNLSTDVPAMRALGVAPLIAHVKGAVSLDSAIEQSKVVTRQYVKRQQTWLKRNMTSWTRLDAQYIESNAAIIDAIV